MIEVGRVLGARGLKGEIRVRLYRAEPELLELGRLALALEGGEARTFAVRGEPRWTDRLTAVVALEGIDTRDEAERWIGAAASVDRAWVPEGVTIPAAMLIGARAVEEGGAPIGCVEDLFDNGAQMVLVIREGEREVMVPYVEALIAGVKRDADGLVVEIRALPGLLE